MQALFRNLSLRKCCACLKTVRHQGVGVGLFCLLILAGISCEARTEVEALPPGHMAPPPENPHAAGKPTSAPLRLGADYLLHLFPSGDFYRPYAADPHRNGFGIQRMNVTDGRIPNVGGARYALKAGGYFGVLRLQPSDNPDVGVQLDIGGGLDGQYDLDSFNDNVGWNGHYGMLLTASPARPLAFKLALQHISGHVGDEFFERTGRRRIGYTRMELAPAVSWNIDKNWRTYAEYGWGYELLNYQLQKPHRVQFGLEYEYPLWRGLGCYAAGDFSATQERDWRLDNSLQIGFIWHAGPRSWRFGFERYHGRPTMSEFFQHTETSTSFGLWLDL